MTTDTAPPATSVDVGRINPYVGPRSLRRGELIFGRDVEIRELRASLLAHRIVLLYSQSGAGKTSIIEAGLRPELEEREFQVFPTIRVGYEPPDDAAPSANRYRLSVMASLEASRSPEAKLEPSELAGMGLDEYFFRLDQELPDRDPCLVFDQFEELFTLDPVDWDEKEAFLRELGEALTDRGRWALFAMREDFIAQLDPYVGLIPTRFGTRYRIDLLGPTAAKEAITRPAVAMGLGFSDEAAELLVDDLRRVQVQRGRESIRELGPSVEPVQLQVVCNRLWARLPSGATTIGPDDVITAGDVNKALAAFYDAQVKAAASPSGTREREVRGWVGHMLITVDGFRTQVRTGPGRSGQAVLRTLEDTHLIRSDRIRGAQWYELSHDRFVEPIRASNAKFQKRRRRRRIRVAAGVVAAFVAAWIGLSFFLAFFIAFESETFTGALLNISADVTAVEVNYGETRTGTINEPGANAVYRFDTAARDDVMAIVEPQGELVPGIVLRDSDGEWLAETVGLPGEPLALVAQDLTAGEHVVFVTVTSGSIGDFEFALQRPEVGNVVLGDAAFGLVTEETRVGVHTFTGSTADSLVVTVTPKSALIASASVFGPDGAFISDGVGFEDFPAAVVVAPTTDGTHLITVTGLEGSEGSYEVVLAQLVADWDLTALIPSFAAGLGPADYWIDLGGTSTNCEPWDASGLDMEQAMRFTPRAVSDHTIWAWSAQFSSPDGVDSYLGSWGSGCSFQIDETTALTLFAPEALNDEVLWYVVVYKDEDGVTLLDSVGVIGHTDRDVAEAQVFVRAIDGSAERIPIDPGEPYANPVARMIAEEVAEEVIRVREGL